MLRLSPLVDTIPGCVYVPETLDEKVGIFVGNKFNFTTECKNALHELRHVDKKLLVWERLIDKDNFIWEEIPSPI